MRQPARSVTYLERAQWFDLGLLSPADTRLALAGTTAAAGRSMSRTAAELLAQASGGYPYAIQVFGRHAWRTSERRGATQVTLAHARAALAPAEAELTSGLYAARWDDASPKERDYLRSVATTADDSGTARGGEIARLHGQTPRSVSYLRERLVRKGTLFGQGEQLRLVVPGMAEFIRGRFDALQR